MVLDHQPQLQSSNKSIRCYDMSVTVHTTVVVPIGYTPEASEVPVKVIYNR
jgi:hypothetical protein